MTQNNVLYAFVADGAQNALPTGAVSGLTNGYIGVVKESTGLMVNGALSANDTVRIVKNSGGVYQYSPRFKFSDVIAKGSAGNTAASQFVGYLGYNGTSGDIDAEVDTVYTPKLIVKDVLTTFGNKSMIKEGVYKTGSSSPVYKSDVATGLARSFIANMEKEPEEYVKISVITSAAVTAANAFDNDATVVNGEKTITVGTNLQYNGGAGTATEGDFVRVGTVGGGTALGDNVYKITEIVDTTHFKVDRPILEASGTYAAATADLEVIPLATVHNSATKYGLKFLGVARTNFKPGIFKYMVYNFDILQGANFDDVPVTTTGANQGTNTYEQVAETEWFAQGNRGYGDRIDSIPVESQVTASSSVTYTSVSLKIKSAQFTDVIGNSPASLVELKMFGVAGLKTALETVFAI